MSLNDDNDTLAGVFDVDGFVVDDDDDGRIKLGMSFCMALRRLVDVCC